MTRPVTAVHLGLGAFHRAHQAWCTGADPAAGIAAYTRASTELPRLLTEQGCHYHLLVRGDGEPRPEPVEAIVRARPGTDSDAWCADMAAGSTTVLTLTITEAGYRDPATLARILDGLRARHASGGAPIALVPCDNLAGNGGVLRTALLSVVDGEPRLAEWIAGSVSFVDTVVDRITPATTGDDVAEAARLLGPRVRDAVPVVTEPYHEWVLAGRFPLGRPDWEAAGAQVVDDVAPYARRKLWFLNGAHSLLAYAGPAHGVSTVDEAMADARLSGLLDSWWDAASRHLDAGPHPPDPHERAVRPAEVRERSARSARDGGTLDPDGYRRRLRARFANPGIRHRLAQIARDGSQKIPARILPVLARERAAGRMPEGAVAALAGWVAHLRAGQVHDPHAERLVAAARSGGTRGVLVALGTAPVEPTSGAAADPASGPGAGPGRVPRRGDGTAEVLAATLAEDGELIAETDRTAGEFTPPGRPAGAG